LYYLAVKRPVVVDIAGTYLKIAFGYMSHPRRMTLGLILITLNRDLSVANLYVKKINNVVNEKIQEFMKIEAINTRIFNDFILYFDRFITNLCGISRRNCINGPSIQKVRLERSRVIPAGMETSRAGG
jgi:hypothetical protein